MVNCGSISYPQRYKGLVNCEGISYPPRYKALVNCGSISHSLMCKGLVNCHSVICVEHLNGAVTQGFCACFQIQEKIDHLNTSLDQLLLTWTQRLKLYEQNLDLLVRTCHRLCD